MVSSFPAARRTINVATDPGIVRFAANPEALERTSHMREGSELARSLSRTHKTKGTLETRLLATTLTPDNIATA